MIIIGFMLSSFVYWSVENYCNQKSWWRKRSCCDQCLVRLKVIDLIPFISFMLLRGRASCCNGIISKKYFITEVIVVVLMLPLGFEITLTNLLEGIVVLLLFWMTLVDYQTLHIPIPIVVVIMMIGLYLRETACEGTILIPLLLCVLLYIIFRHSLGSGDIWLFAALSTWMDVITFMFFVGFSAVLALVYVILMDRQGLVPFCPFIGSSFYIVIVMEEVFRWAHNQL
ncbi:prepilin peptidase [Brochothrix thermosphacta]|uniref:prepilin peptidase n=1 Tax=Brochothrix thermosphacta TaxID=2756 RepID=UPI0003E8BD59|nr:prepilin peptidase [Brochothrix thermosphacta]EUJ34419.1 peptidase A24A domain protein [Brochothrix thermosphacta DSM 20171 = FSL F6-1036]ODJ48051.1 hypothetical protein BFR34_11065 [Brochothrix thermosphacta DSM 20171 = FSL F6-1036]